MDAYETRVYTALLITCLLVGSIIAFFIVSAVRHQRRFIELQRRLFLREVDLLERDRARVARDLHDELGPLVSLTRMQISTLQPTTDGEEHCIERASENLIKMTKRLGEITANLSPGVLVRKGLRVATEHYLKELSETSGITHQFIYRLPTEPSLTVSIHLYRIIREMGHNCLKHSQATELLIRLEKHQGQLLIYYEDNGRGFPKRMYPEPNEGEPLYSIKGRTEMLGGRVGFISVPGKGVQIHVKIPFDATTPTD